METQVKTESEKPWYLPMILGFLTQDVPRVLGLSQHLFERDVTTLVQRLSAEGESFLTKTLPSFGKSIDLALQGHVPLATASFKKRGRSALPAFLSALLRRVFKDDGWVRDIPCIQSIRLLRQLTFWCKKLEKGYSDESLRKAMEDFIEVDQALPTCAADLAAAGSHLGVARAVVERIFRDIGKPSRCRPGHGPGAVAGGEGVVGKRHIGHAFENLERIFRPIPFFFSLRDAAESPERITGRLKCKYGLSKTTFVEKDSSGPRTIGLEPAEYMWCQQGIKALMYDHIETRSIARGRVNFTNQHVNRSLARDWSGCETLDMSKASDRNSLALVEYLYGHTKLWPYLQACRTPGTVLPDGSILMFKKFAPMGSAVCFPVQAVVYYALAVAALHLAGMPLFVACRKTYVYGDDLIVPRGYYPILERVFGYVGLKFNADKCCTHGRFRESCGLDAFAGEDVTPVRFRRADVRDHSDLVRIVKHHNALHDAGYWSSAEGLRLSALKQYSELKALRLPFAVRRSTVRYPLQDRIDRMFGLSKMRPSYGADESAELPILSWRCHAGEESLRYRWNKTRQAWTLLGWLTKPKSLVSPAELEVKHLRESLSRGGPVGRWSGERDPDRPYCFKPKTERRELDLRYSNVLVKSRVVVSRE